MNSNDDHSIFEKALNFLLMAGYYLVVATVVGFVISIFYDPLTAQGDDPLNIGDFIAIWIYAIAAFVVFRVAQGAIELVQTDLANHRRRKAKPIADLDERMAEVTAELRILREKVEHLEEREYDRR